MSTPQLKAKAKERMERLGKLVRPPKSSAIREVEQKTVLPIEKKYKTKEEKNDPPGAPPKAIDLSYDYNEEQYKSSIFGNKPKTRAQLRAEAEAIFAKADNMTNIGGRTKKRRRRKRKTRKRKRKRTKKRRKSRRKKRRRTRK